MSYENAVKKKKGPAQKDNTVPYETRLKGLIKGIEQYQKEIRDFD